jgi:AGZA family xanthine/uracil permease-like MFS transporter
MFKLKSGGLNPIVEITAGLTTFFSMVYVLAVNPQILSQTGMPVLALFTATALGTILATLLMAFGANLPFAVAPGMGLNAFFVVMVMQMGFTWNQALTAVLISGVLFVALSLSPIREAVLRDVPNNLKSGVCAGIGVMISYIGLLNSRVVVLEGGMPALGQIHSGPALLTLIGLAVTATMLALRFRFAILAGVAATTVIGVPLGVTDLSGLSGGLISAPPSVAQIAFKFDFTILSNSSFWGVVVTLLFMEVMDGLAGFLGLFGVMGKDGDRYRSRMGKAFVADSVGVVVGASLGLSPNTTYAESGAGVAAGGRTGLTALTVAVCFILSLFISPLFMVVPFSAVAPALVMVGLLMIRNITLLNFDDYGESFPAFVTAVIIALTFRVSDGLTIGWIIHILMKVVGGKYRSISRTVWAMGFVLALNWVTGFMR